MASHVSGLFDLFDEDRCRDRHLRRDRRCLLLAFCLLLACGYFVEGAESGMTPVLSVRLARSAIKAFSFLSVGIDKIAEWTAKAELRILHIE